MEKQSPTLSPHRVAFYPCCAGDLEEPRRILAPYVDEILFCDLRKSKAWDRLEAGESLPKATFLQGDANALIDELENLTVLFYRRDNPGEGGSNLPIMKKEMLSRILSHFDPAGGWIFSDGSMSGKTFNLICSKEWHPKPSLGFQFREREKSSLETDVPQSLYVIEVKPLVIKAPAMRAGWVPPHGETLDDLINYCTSNNRLVPQPPQWSELFSMLKNTRQKPSGGWEPPLPLILAAWHHSMPIEKQLRFKDHIAWAQTHNQLEEIGRYLRSLSEEQWCHFGE